MTREFRGGFLSISKSQEPVLFLEPVSTRKALSEVCCQIYLSTSIDVNLPVSFFVFFLSGKDRWVGGGGSCEQFGIVTRV